MKTSNLLVALATLVLFFSSACTQEQVNPGPQIGAQGPGSEPTVLGEITGEGFIQSCTESDLVDIMDTYRGNEDEFIYTSASIIKNGSLYMIKSPTTHPDGYETKVYMHLEEIDNEIVFDAQKIYTKISCYSTGCRYPCQYYETASCYDCDCAHPFDDGSCGQIIHAGTACGN